MGVVAHADRLELVGELAPQILAGGDKAQELRRLPDDIVSNLVDKGFFRFALPEELGGDNASSMQTVEVLEAIASVDASVAWNVMLGSEINAMAAGGMDPKIAEQIYLENPNVIMCGGGGPGSKPPRAERTNDGGVRVWGQSTFISGCYNASWCFMMAPIMHGDTPELDDDGNPVAKMWMMPRSEWSIEDTWDVAGLRGSGSHDVVADGAHVAPEHVGVDLVSIPAHYSNPVYRIPVPLRLSYNKVAIALGVARGAIGAFSDLAQDKVPMMSAATLKHRPIAQFRMGEAMATYRAARAYVLDAMSKVEAELAAGAARPEPRLPRMPAWPVCLARMSV